MSHKKISFLTIFALVISSQVGSGIFMLPISLAPYGIYSLISWVISGLGAISLALVFALLCARFPKTGGPHVYVKHAFGNVVAFFTGWTYWVISWVSSIAVIVTSVGYLSPFFHGQNVRLYLEILLFTIITLINLRGVTVSGYVEFCLTMIKVVVLSLIPAMALCYFNKNNFVVSQEVSNLTTPQILARATLITLWCFIGLEAVTAPAGSVSNPSKTIPRAILLGTICSVIIYFVNNLAIMGLINGNDLAHSHAPYVDAMEMILHGNLHLIMSVIASIFCIGTLNAWVLSSGQVALGLAEDKLMPQIFARKNRYNTPFFGIIISYIGTLPLLVLTSNSNFASQITSVIDFSVVSFLFVYLTCSLAFFKFSIQEKNGYKLLIGGIAMIFCFCLILATSVGTLLKASLFTLSGIPVYLLWRGDSHHGKE